MLTNLPVPYDNCVGVSISHQLTVGSTSVYNSVLNVKALVGAFNQEKALVGAFSVIVKTDCGTDGSFYSTTKNSSSSWLVTEVKLEVNQRNALILICRNQTS